MVLNTPYGTHDIPHSTEHPHKTQDIPHSTHHIPHGTETPHGTAHIHKVSIVLFSGLQTNQKEKNLLSQGENLTSISKEP